MKGWRTMTVFGLTGLTYLLTWDQLTKLVDPQVIAVTTSILAIAMRWITTGPVGQATTPVPTTHP